MKSASPESDKAEDGTPMVDIVSKLFETVQKAAGTALSQEEASNLHGDKRTESLGDRKGAAGEALGGQVGPNGNTSAPEGQALSQEEASNLHGDTRTESLGDKKGAASDPLGGQVGSSEGGAKTETIGNAHQAPETEAISDGEAAGKFGDVQKGFHVFKSLNEAKQFSHKHPEFRYVEPTTIQEKNAFGKRYTFAARKAETVR
jgi:hypothetical protein